ncbi:MAG: hypothetical protein RIR12_885 [Bacteroidota bacterium]|jgi:hypothetical protein
MLDLKTQQIIYIPYYKHKILHYGSIPTYGKSLVFINQRPKSNQQLLLNKKHIVSARHQTLAVIFAESQTLNIHLQKKYETAGFIKYNNIIGN